MIQPGAIDTETNPRVGGLAYDVLKNLASLGRYGRPEDLAGAVALLVFVSALDSSAADSQEAAVGHHWLPLVDDESQPSGASESSLIY